jgi:uncharacterized membrane protein
MPLQEQCERSRSLAIYEWLIRLYPRAYLRRHRDELLQNFQDLEQELPSKAALWCFIARDLMVSLRSEFIRTFWGQTAMTFAVLSLILAVAHWRPGKHEPYIWSCLLGYVLGWFVGWLGFDWRMSSRSRLPMYVRSFRGQATMLLCAIAIVLITSTRFPELRRGLVVAACYGTALAWVTGWGKKWCMKL